eukprot:7291157-Lingulodinium_polyedra.AAC.1
MACAKRAVCKPLWRQTVDSTPFLRSVCKTLHTDAVASTVCRCSGSQTARLRTPCARSKTG